MSPAFYFRQAFRESRGAAGRLTFFTVCLSVGVAAVVAVAGISEGMNEALRTEARKLLAADLVVQSRRPFSPEVTRTLDALPGAAWSTIRELPSVIAAPARDGRPGPSVLAELKAVQGEYPYYGELVMKPEGRLDRLVDAHSVIVAPAVLDRLDLKIGESLLVGGERFTIAGVVTREPDRIGVSFTLGPRVLLTATGLERAGLERFGSRILYRALVKLPDGSSRSQVRETAERLRQSLPDAGYLRVETYIEAQPTVRSSIRRADRFLGLVALLSLFVGGIGVAQAVRAWLAGQIDSIAVLKSLGMRPREVMTLYLGQTIILGLIGSVVGVAAGIVILAVTPSIAGDLLPIDPGHPLRPFAVLRGMALGVGVALLFSLPSLLGLLRVPPARVLRSDAEPLPPNRPAAWGAAILLLTGIATMAVVQSGSITRGSQFTLGVVIAASVLGLAAAALSRGIGRLPRNSARIWIRYGLAALSRPGSGTLGALVALGLGVMVVLSMYLVQRGLGDQLQAELPGDAPTAYLVDVQPDQWDGVRKVLTEAGASRIDSVPVIMARLRRIDGRDVQDALADLDPDRPDHGRRRWILSREQRLTYMEALPEDNVIVRGALWSEPALPEVSVEVGFAEDLPADVGSTLTFDIQGVPIDLRVSSIRSVEWQRFGINFFLVAEPGVLDDAPQFRVVAARLPERSEQQVQDRLVAAFPNVTLLDIRAILEKVAGVVDRVGFGVRLLGGFTVLAGIAILAGAVSAGSVRRAREVALLKTLGMTRGGVVAVFTVEYALIGLVAGVIGSAGAGLLSWAVLTRCMEIGWQFDPLAHTAAVAGSVVLTVAAGIATSARPLLQKPVEILRGH